jgi:hypothetical protein
MASKKTRRPRKAAPAAAERARPTSPPAFPETPQPFFREQLTSTAQRSRPGARARIGLEDVNRRLRELNMRPTVDRERLIDVLERIRPDAQVPVKGLPEDIRETLATMRPGLRRFHGAKIELAWFPWPWIFSPCADKFGYMSSPAVRAATKLPFNAATQARLTQLGNLMADPGRESSVADSTIPAGFTYVGQFVDHDITFDISSTLDAPTDANIVNNMRSPALDLDSVYGRGPALDPYLYVFPTSGPSTAIKFHLGSNTPQGAGGPGGAAGAGGMQQQTDFDVPRVLNPLNPVTASHTAIIGDPRNDENLIIVQFHHAMLRFHNQVVDLLLLAGFTGDIFVEAKRIVTHHYQWAVVHDFLRRVCGMSAVTAALGSVVAPVNSPFRMPVEFAVAAYRFGHSMIRQNYWINFNFINASLGEVFDFSRVPRLPVFSNWVVDLNAFFDTGVSVPVNNKARRIDSVLAPGLELLPGFAGMMAVLAARNLRRGLALGLPSGQGMANAFGLTPMTAIQLKQGLPADEIALLDADSGLLLKKTPLWYYVLREASVLAGGNQLGPVGARIVAETIVRILKRDPSSYLNAAGGFTPFLPAASAGDFTFADLLIFAGVTQP